MDRQEKRHFIVLDGLRGLAALAVAFLHASQIMHLPITLHHANLAVDFFFVLSGFVVAYAYDQRLKTDLPITSFALKRIIRLYPMIFIGVALGSAATLSQAWLDHYGLRKGILFSISAFLLIPIGLVFKNQAYPVNNPIWSLFFEAFANIAYGFTTRFAKGPRYIFPFLLTLSALILAFFIYRNQTIDQMGFQNKSMFLLGFVRVAFPFLAGLAIYRWKAYIPSFHGYDYFLGICVLIVLFIPFFPFYWLYDTIVIIFVFPAFVSVGTNAGSQNMIGFWKLSGKLSYPFYIIHQPILRLATIVSSYCHGIIPPTALAVFSIVIAAVLAFALLRLYDEPLRSYLSRIQKDVESRRSNRINTTLGISERLPKPS